MTLSPPQQALITGASSGIGYETAKAFAQAGFNLILASRSEAKLNQVAEEIRAEYSDISVHVCPIDLAEIDTVHERVTALIETAGTIDVLINNAGIGYTESLADMSLADWQRVMNVNLAGAWQCIQAVLPGMRDRQAGTIINLGSIAAHNAFPSWGAYSASKAGLISLSKVLAIEEQPHGIRVMVVSPGAVNTPIWDTDTVNADFDRSGMLTPAVVAQSILHATLLPKGSFIEELTLVPATGAL